MLRWFRNRRRSELVLSTNEEWLYALQGENRDHAITELRVILVNGLRPVVARRVERDADMLVEDFVQESLLRILDSLDTFRGDSHFTTWAHKICVRVAFTELRRKRWEDVSLDALMDTAGDTAVPESGLLSGTPERPDDTMDLKMMMNQVQQIMDEVLSDPQRTAINAVMVKGMPLEEVARRMGTNRNALYKLIHDARKKMKAALEERGISIEEIMKDL